jgi:hypothetical protein
MISCCKCSNMAVWFYQPMSDSLNRYFCDECIKRGCSCNINPDTGQEDLDELGRCYPCCEYDYDDRGFSDI